MIELPEEVLRQRIVPGTIIKTEVSYPDGATSVKRCIVVSKDNDHTILTTLSTSQIHNADRFNRSKLKIEAGKSSIFEIDTIIEGHRIFELETRKICEKINHRQQFEIQTNILGNIESQWLKEICDMLLNSKTIERKFKHRIKAALDSIEEP